MMGNNFNFKYFFSIEKRTKYFLYIIAFLSVAAIVIFGLLIIGENALNKKVGGVAETKINPFDNIEIEAKGVVVWDVVNERELFSKNPDLPLPLASLTKIMTALISDSNLPDSSRVKIAEEYLQPEGDSGLLVGDSWKASDLRDFTLLTSSNDGALALSALSVSKPKANTNDFDNSRMQFIKQMNDKALEIGLSNSRFLNEHGLDKSTDRGGAYGSAQDMAILLEYIMQNRPHLLEATRYKNLAFASAEKVYNADNTNAFVDQIPGLIASKTGYTDLAGGNLVIAFDAGLNRPIIISILGSSTDGRFSDALKLVEASIEYIHDN